MKIKKYGLTFLLYFVCSFGFLAFLHAQEWGMEEKGLQVRLVPLQQNYTIGQRMIFKLEMRNVSAAVIQFASLESVWLNDGMSHRIVEAKHPASYIEFSNAMSVKDATGKESLFLANATYQTINKADSINPGETIILHPGFDIAALYLINQTGTYTIQFRGFKGIMEQNVPVSNVLTINMEGEAQSSNEGALEKLQKALPMKWSFAVLGKDEEVCPLGRDFVKGMHVVLEGNPTGLIADVSHITVWVTEQTVEKNALYRLGGSLPNFKWEGKTLSMGVNKEVTSGGVSEYLGKSPWGYVYIFLSENALSGWSRCKEDIGNALEIKP